MGQLTNNYKEQSEISFLKGVEPHPDNKIIVTTLSFDEKYKYLCSKKLELCEVPSVEVETLFLKDVASIQSFTSDIMRRSYNRKLTLAQWDVYLDSANEEPSVLYLNLSLYIMSLWQSFDSNIKLMTTVPLIINQIFDNLERQFGSTLIQGIFTCLSYAIDGVDVLSLNDGLLNFVFQYSRPDINRLPYHVWLRIRAALGPLVVERKG